MEQVEILIVGGGVGGLAAALTIAETGRDVHVIEAAPEFGEIGAGIQLGPNATRVLSAIGLLDEVEEGAVRPRELVYMDASSGERISSLDCGDALIERYGFPYIVVHRSDLHRKFYLACEAHPRITLETDRLVTEVIDRDPGAEVVCANGARYAADALIGADGLHSTVRKAIVDDEPVPSEFVAYRGAIPFDQVTPHAGSDSMVMWVGPDLHMVQYKLRGGKLYNQVGVFRSYSYSPGDQEWGTPEELDEHFGACCEPVSTGAALLSRDAKWPMFDRDPIDNWTRGRITLIGDAAHPMLQYLAQGGCQAIEDAFVIGREVAAHADIGDAFLAYQAQRIPRTAAVQTNARRWGEACHLGGVAAEIRNGLFSQHEPRDYRPFDWLYENVIDVPEAATV